jgi:hypothetical protein
MDVERHEAWGFVQKHCGRWILGVCSRTEVFLFVIVVIVVHVLLVFILGRRSCGVESLLHDLTCDLCVMIGLLRANRAQE